MGKKKKTKILAISTAAGTCILALIAVFILIKITPSDVSVPPAFSLTEPPPAVEDPKLPDDWWKAYNYVPSPSGMSGMAETLLKINDEYAGWITIDGTKVNEPVVLDPGAIYDKENPEKMLYQNNEYYLHYYMDGTPSRGGTVFMDYRNDFGSAVTPQSNNILLHGHNMSNNTMFGSLRRYRQDYSTYDESPIIRFSSGYEDCQYIIFGFYVTSGVGSKSEFHFTDPESGEELFGYWNMVNLNSEEMFNHYVGNVQSRSMVDTGVDVKYGDELLTLSTCYAREDDSRFIVVARKLRDHENTVENIDKTEAYLEKKRQEEEAAAAIEAEKSSKAAAETAISQETT